MKKILVSGASGIVGYGILQSLRRSGKEIHLLGATIYNDSVAPAFCDTFIQAQKTDDAGYIDWLCSTIIEHKVDMIIPGIDADMYKWAENLEQLEQTGVIALINKVELINLCKDKWKFYRLLKERNSQYVIPSSLNAHFTQLSAEYGLPFLLKPRHGFGSKGIVTVHDRDTFEEHRANVGQVLLVQPIIGTDDDEYTTSAFCDGKGGVMAFMTLRRKLSKDGFTEKAEVVNLQGIKEALNELCKILQPIGPTNFQFRLADGALKLLEINPRISSATSIRSSFGYNESLLSLEYYLDGITPQQPVIKAGKAVRYVEDHIFYS